MDTNKLYGDMDLNIIKENSPFVGTDGTKYPSNYPKEEITELTLVTKTAAPADTTVHILGFILDSTYTQVWQTEPKTTTELSTMVMDKWKKNMAKYDTSMPRSMEEHIENHHGGVTGDPYSQEIYDVKKALRLTKPKD